MGEKLRCGSQHTWRNRENHESDKTARGRVGFWLLAVSLQGRQQEYKCHPANKTTMFKETTWESPWNAAQILRIHNFYVTWFYSFHSTSESPYQTNGKKKASSQNMTLVQQSGLKHLGLPDASAATVPWSSWLLGQVSMAFCRKVCGKKFPK